MQFIGSTPSEITQSDNTNSTVGDIRASSAASSSTITSEAVRPASNHSERKIEHQMPISLQKRIMGFVGSIPSSDITQSEDTNSSVGDIGASSSPIAFETTHMSKNSFSCAGIPREMRLSPSDVYILSQETGPGFVIIDNFLERSKKLTAASVADAASKYEGLRPAGMGRGLGRWAAEDKRGDKIAWLKRDGTREDSEIHQISSNASPKSSALFEFLDEMEALRIEITEKWGLSECNEKAKNCDIRLSRRMTHQLAHYPGNGTGYVRHRDAYPPSLDSYTNLKDRKEDYRQLTVIYYLNRHWTPQAGGKLRLYSRHPAASSSTDGLAEAEIHWDIEPVIDRLVIFRADRIEHEVLPAYRERLALTTWMYGCSHGHSSGQLVKSSGRRNTEENEKNSKSGLEKSTTQDYNATIGREIEDHVESTTVAPKVQLTSPFSHVSILSGKKPSNYVEATRQTRCALPISLPLSRHGSRTIFVSIASYRDSECQHTLLDLFATAYNPYRVFVGVVGQYKFQNHETISTISNLGVSQEGMHEDDDCCCFTASPLPVEWATQVRCLNISWNDAKGPCWARHLAQKLWAGEEFFLQIDSHMRFRPNWDSYLVGLIEELEAQSGTSSESICNPRMEVQNMSKVDLTASSSRKKKVVLTTYPLGYTINPTNISKDIRPTLLCPVGFGGANDDGILRQTGRLLRHTASKPLPSYLWAAGFNFSRAKETIVECPYDPHLPFLFFGEEISMAARLWTHGYDLYAPPETVLYHLWKRDHRPVLQKAKKTPEQAKLESQSIRRIHYLLGVPNLSLPNGNTDEGINSSKADIHTYGLGKARTLMSFEDALGVNFRKGSFTRPDVKWGGIDPKQFNELDNSAASILSAFL